MLEYGPYFWKGSFSEIQNYKNGTRNGSSFLKIYPAVSKNFLSEGINCMNIRYFEKICSSHFVYMGKL